MSHFTVLVIGDDVEGQLQPYHEYECTDVEDEYVKHIDIMEEAVHAFENGTTVKYKNIATGELVDSDASFYRELTSEEKKEHGPIMGTGCGGGKSWTSRDWEDGKGYRTKMFEIPEGFEEVRIAYEEATTLHEYTADWWGLDIIEGDAPALSNQGYVRVVDGVMTEAFKYTNPNAKWDWWLIGGRWSNMLRLKPIQLLPSTEMFTEFGFSQAEFLNLVNLYKESNGKFQQIVEKYKGRADDIVAAIETYLRPVYTQGNTGSKGVMGAKHSEDAPNHCDQCRIGDLDIDAMEKEATDEARVRYAEFKEKVLDKMGDMKPVESWKHVREIMYPGDIEAARAYYNGHPFMELCRTAKINTWGDVVETYHVGEPDAENKYIEDARCAAFSTFAVVKGGEWYEKGEMGWWGVVHDEKLRYDWDAKFSELIHDLPDDTMITVVDCHI